MVPEICQSLKETRSPFKIQPLDFDFLTDRSGCLFQTEYF